MKTFFDGMFLDCKELREAGIEYPIKLEYFKTANEKNVNTIFGIQVVKTEYLENNVNVETKEIEDLTENEEELNEILTILKNNSVTPIGVEDVLQEIKR